VIATRARLATGGAAGVIAILASIASCARELPAGPQLGASDDALEVDYCILNVHTDEETVHFEGPDWMIASVEGAGPLNLDLRVLKFLIPTMSTTGHYKPKESTVSTAVGYSMQERYGVNDYTRLAVNTGTFQRVEAYADFQRTAFEIHDAGCGALLGTGASYRPIGVYFRAVDATDVALPDIGVHLCVPVDEGPPPPPPPPAGSAQADAGPKDAGPKDAGPKDAGPKDAGPVGDGG
jgi:hypothetical protein